MAEVRGVFTQLNHVLPSGLDPTRLAQWRLGMNGRTYDQVRADLAASFDGLNRDLLTVWGDMIYITTDDHVEYSDGGATRSLIDITDVDRPDSWKGSTVGHMIDLRVKTPGALGGSERYFRDARESQLVATVNDFVTVGVNGFEQSILTRALSNDEIALGSAGYTLGYASASASVTWTPPQVGGTSFLSTHTHYVGYNASTPLTLENVLDGLATHLAEHGHQAPYIAYVSSADAATYRGLTNFVQPMNGVTIMDRGGASSGTQWYVQQTVQANTKMGGRFIGFYNSNDGIIELRATGRLATGYVAMYKSYGNNDPRNPIYVRVHPDVGFGFRIKEIPSFETTWPIKRIEIEIEYGVAAGRDRTVGASGYLVAGGTWVDATVS